MKGKIKLLILWLLSGMAFVLADQFTKRLAVRVLKGHSSIVLIKNVLELSYVENRGAAFGMFTGFRVPFLAAGLVVLGAVTYVLLKLPESSGSRYMPFCWSLVVIASGAVGNMADRAVNGYVVDFIYFSLIDFPVFNVADIWVTCGTIFFAFLIIFYYKEDDFKWIKRGSGTPE